ncbi:transcriptional regulator, AraC family with amidase-like domain [Rhizobium tibeticum]|uniref:Carnitine catabolism transcriptional activator n=2 Tax=Rhizobium tibeticum TaxID=501024 RepID=A0A1H8WB28_9HYPH|nr:Carnitine catabolism transcriptional activator [Rhizobium tibeticum]SEP24844.1 transcriptional regulator, AraC family with amidase-like domain [Rhizobium tibeticum]
MTQRMGFVLTPNFALMSYASAIEPLRAANLISGLQLYDVVTLSSGGHQVRSSSGLMVECRSLAEEGQDFHTVFVCAGGVASDWVDSDGLYGALRKLSRQGVRIGGISSGAYVLAAAGLIENRDFTIHWEHATLLKEAFPNLSPRHARYVIDGDRITCGGGVAPLDMMHATISERMGSHFARRVSDWYLHTVVSEPTASQRGSAAERFSTHHPALLTVLEKMEDTIEQPLSRTALAQLVGISTRHLDRLFTSETGISFLETYRSIRLRHAQRLLEQSPLSISEIAFATGFSSASHFSRALKSLTGKSPGNFRLKFPHD